MNQLTQINNPLPDIDDLAKILTSETGTGYVYATSYSNGMTKVGMSRNSPTARIKAHNAAMRNAGERQVEQFISKKILQPHKIEIQLIKALRSKCRSSSREWFDWCDIEWVAQFVEKAGHPVEKIDFTPELKEKIKGVEKARHDSWSRALDKIRPAQSLRRPSIGANRYINYINLANCLHEIVTAEGSNIDRTNTYFEKLFRTRESPGEPDHSYFSSLVALLFMSKPDDEWRGYFAEAAIDPAGLSYRIIKESLALAEAEGYIQ